MDFQWSHCHTPGFLACCSILKRRIYFHLQYYLKLGSKHQRQKKLSLWQNHRNEDAPLLTRVSLNLQWLQVGCCPLLTPSHASINRCLDLQQVVSLNILHPLLKPRHKEQWHPKTVIWPQGWDWAVPHKGITNPLPATSSWLIFTTKWSSEPILPPGTGVLMLRPACEQQSSRKGLQAVQPQHGLCESSCSTVSTERGLRVGAQGTQVTPPLPVLSWTRGPRTAPGQSLVTQGLPQGTPTLPV